MLFQRIIFSLMEQFLCYLRTARKTQIFFMFRNETRTYSGCLSTRCGPRSWCNRMWFGRHKGDWLVSQATRACVCLRECRLVKVCVWLNVVHSLLAGYLCAVVLVHLSGAVLPSTCRFSVYQFHFTITNCTSYTPSAIDFTEAGFTYLGRCYRIFFSQ